MSIFLQLTEPIIRLPFWPFLLSLLMLAAVLYVRSQNLYSWNLVWKSTYSMRASQQLIREENILESAHAGVLVFVFFISVSLFLYNANDVLHLVSHPNPVFRYVVILMGLVLLYVLKILLLGFFQWIFQLRELFDEYLVGAMNINIVLGVALIPLNLLMIYGKSMDTVSLLLLAGGLYFLSFVIRYLRVVQMGVSSNVYWYNIILYLCTLEIIPILLLVEMLDYVGINLNPG